MTLPAGAGSYWTISAFILYGRSSRSSKYFLSVAISEPSTRCTQSSSIPLPSRPSSMRDTSHSAISSLLHRHRQTEQFDVLGHWITVIPVEVDRQQNPRFVLQQNDAIRLVSLRLQLLHRAVNRRES